MKPYVNYQDWIEAQPGTLIAEYNGETITELYIKINETETIHLYDEWNFYEEGPTKLHLSTTDSYTDYEVGFGKCFVDEELQKLVYEL